MQLLINSFKSIQSSLCKIGHAQRCCMTLIVLLFSGSGHVLLADVSIDELPYVDRLLRGDAIFDQLTADIVKFYRAQSLKQRLPSLNFVKYLVKKQESIYSISARLNIPYSTIVSLNRLDNPARVSEGLELVLPNLAGIFLIDPPLSQLEQLLGSRLAQKRSLVASIRLDRGTRVESFSFFPGEDFSPHERLAFLGSLFQSPLTSYRLSSPYGPRRNPITGALILHEGIDMVAPFGTNVMAAADGTVSDTGFHIIYGNYVVLDHGNGYTSMYGHLSKVSVKRNQRLRAGQNLGNIGNTGQSTGAHLHFEILFNGKARDPKTFIQ